MIDHDEAMRLAATEYDRLLDLVDDLGDLDWSRPTDCPSWTVRDMVGHMLGMLELLSDPTEMRRQVAAATDLARSTGGLRLDALTDLQVREHAHLHAADVREALHERVPSALAARRATTPERRSLPYDPSLPHEPVWSLGYLFDIIHTRDPWMHRIDICRATGRAMRLDADHDGRVVADVVGDWAQRHGKPVHLVLTGPAGGRYRLGDDGSRLDLDAVEFCRILSGRQPASGVLGVRVPF